MKQRIVPLIAAALFLSVVAESATCEVTLEKQDGITYRVVRSVEPRPVVTNSWQEHTETVYKEEYVTETRDSYRTVYTPVTEYRCEQRWHNWWNPLTRPHLAYHVKPVTRWETRMEKYQTPVTYRRVIPETRIVRVPQRKLSFEDRPVIVSRVPVTSQRPLAIRVAPPTASGESIGGISRIENDPPRGPFRPLSDGGTIRR